MSDGEVEFEGNSSGIASESSVRSALFASVEGGADGSEELLSCRPLVNLFFRPELGSIEEGVNMTAREQRDVLLDSIRSHKFHKGYGRRFFAGMTNILKKVIDEESYVPESAFESEDEEEDGERRISYSSTKDPKEIVPDENSTESLMFMKACAFCINAYLDGLVDRRSATEPEGKIYEVIDEAFAVGELLHDVLFSLQSYCGAEGLKVQSIVATMCEKWWQNNFVDRDYMVVQLIPYLVVRSLDGSASKNDVKRLFTMREAFRMLDFEKETIAYLRSLILRTVSSPLYLRMTEGRRLIAYLFCLHESLVGDLHQAIRAQIPEAKKSILESYGDIYFRAWKESNSDPQIRASIEEAALQDLMYAVLHFSSPRMVKSVQAVLKPFYEAKKSEDVGNLLYRMYGPILWRSLEAANFRVRVNAAEVLAETFPLRDPSSGHVNLEKSVTTGVASLKKLLCHSNPKVRIAGAAATTRILTSFWDVLPTSDIRMLLNHIVTELSSDDSSSAVRSAAIDAVTALLDAPQSHAVLRALLPSLGNLIHDKVERVRLAVVRMLLRIKKLRGIKYYHVVPVDHLLGRLAEDGRFPRNPQGVVPSSLTALLLNSYFPQGENVTGADQIKRTLSFLATRPDSASVFYSNVASHLSIHSVAKLAAMLLRCLNSAVATDKARLKENNLRAVGGKKRRSNSSQHVDEESSVGSELNGDGPLTASNTSLMALIAETICTLWESIEFRLKEPRNSSCNDFLLEAFSGVVLTNAHAHFERKTVNIDVTSAAEMHTRDDCIRVCDALLRCASRLPPKSVEGMSSHITSFLTGIEMQEHGDVVGDITSQHIALLCLWGMTEDVATSLSSSIKAAFSNSNEVHSRNFERVANSGKRKSETTTRSGKKNTELVVPPLPPAIALNVLSDILGGLEPSNHSARSCILMSSSACGSLEAALEHATAYAERVLLGDNLARETMEETDVSFILKACEAYGKLALHKEASQNGPLLLGAQAKTLLSWTTDKVVPVILSQSPLTLHPLGDLNISRISAATDSPVAPCSPTPTEPPTQRKNRNSTPLRFSLDSIGDQDNNIAITPDDDAALSRAAAFSLIKSSCVIFSEWVAVGGDSGAEDIANSASKWSQVLAYAHGRNSAQKELLPSFCRLAAQLSLKQNSYTLLTALLVNCVELESDHDESLLRKTVASILSVPDKDGSRLKNSVDAILAAIYEIVKRRPPQPDESFELPEAASDVWGEGNGSLKCSLSAILSSQKAAVILGERLVANLNEVEHNGSQKIPLFEARCIWLLCERLSGRCGGEMRNIVRKLDADRYESDMKGLIGGILDGIPA